MRKNLLLTGLILVVITLSGCGKRIEKSEALQGQPADALSTTDTITVIEETPAVSPEAPQILEPEPNVQAVPQAETPFVKPTVREIQQALKTAGLYQGKIDGVAGPRTERAIEDFQAQNGLKVDGRVGPKTWEKLKPYFNKTEEQVVS